jgi:glutathione peroxidase
MTASSQRAYDFALRAIDGNDLPLAKFKGRPVLVVNTASKCGFTPQYAGLQRLWQEYRDRGLVVLGVPSNDFGNQEPGDAANISNFCQAKFGVDFPLAAKVHVRGREADPLFKWIRASGGFLAQPRWNFYKFLIDGEGQFVTWFSSMTTPTSGKIRRAVEKLLPPARPGA